MSREDRTRWDAKHGAHAGAAPGPPDPFVLLALERLEESGADPRGARAVDLAAGRGRHVLELCRRGWEVEAWDVSLVALEAVEASAAAEGLAVVTRRVDLEGGEAGVDADVPAFDLALVVNFLDRGLLAALPRLVRPGGHLIFATFTTERPGERPSLAHCLEPGELEGGLAGFETVLTYEVAGRASLLARRP